MKRIILFFMIFIFFGMFVSAYGERVVIMKNSFLDKGSLEGKKEVVTALENLLAKHDVEFRIEFISKNMGYAGQEESKNRFYIYGLNERASSSLNLLFTYWKDEQGIPQLDISYSENCGWTEEGLNLLVDIKSKNPKQKEFWLEVIRRADEALTNFDSKFLKTICQMQEEYILEESDCKYFFPDLEEKRTKAPLAKIVFVFEEYDDEDYEKIKPYIKSQILALKDNYSLWNKYFDDFQFVYVDEVMFDTCEGNFDEGRECYFISIFEVANKCSPYQRIAIVSDNSFRSYANFGGPVRLSFPTSFWDNQWSYLFEKDFVSSSNHYLLAHEFGHSLFCFADEYVEEWSLFGSYSEEHYGLDLNMYPNCAPDLLVAQQWWGKYFGQGKNELKVNYYQGCSYVDKNIRPHENSIMRGNKESDYGIVNEKSAESFLKERFIC